MECGSAIAMSVFCVLADAHQSSSKWRTKACRFAGAMRSSVMSCNGLARLRRCGTSGRNADGLSVPRDAGDHTRCGRAGRPGDDRRGDERDPARDQAPRGTRAPCPVDPVCRCFRRSEHLENPDLLMAEVHRVLAPKGLFIASVPAFPACGAKPTSSRVTIADIAARHCCNSCDGLASHRSTSVIASPPSYRNCC